MDGISVYRSRMAMGDALAEKVKQVLQEKNLTIDVVIPVRIYKRLKCGLTLSGYLYLGTRYLASCGVELGSEVGGSLP
jgi:hypothetical protein